ncbi:hypothetical protein CYY_005767 [Polysphondylium violaceum]|uniref:CBF1-interacting co-repressor CIR N-terminal domain-containing protein n=1 Tax=Polysphondylium violaceum TaxID=133409 RepID=A0A8J4PS99_9MYCE|nr:hypothetical protein CYY_005767 [Polysphondylium violaceum]
MTHILKHKTWNPYSSKNKEKVERDEREHNEKLFKENQKKIRIESEKRYSQLKNNLKRKGDFDEDEVEDGHGDNIDQDERDTQSKDDKDNQQQHINLFQGITGDQIFSSKSKEKKLKQQIVSEGVRLGEGCIDNSPVWIKDNNKKSSSTGNKDDDNDIDERRKRKKEKREQWRLDREDPIHIVEKALGKENTKSSSSSSSSKTISTTSTSTVNKKKTIEELRKERLEREEKERKRANELKSTTSKTILGTGVPQSSVSFLGYSGGIKKR